MVDPLLLPPFSPGIQQSLWLGDAGFASIASESLLRAASKTRELLPPAATSPYICPSVRVRARFCLGGHSDAQLGVMTYAQMRLLRRAQQAMAKDAFPTHFNLTQNPRIASEPSRERQAGNAGWEPAGTAACGEALRCTKGAVILASASQDGHSAV